MSDKQESGRTRGRGTVCLIVGTLLIAAALLLTGYNYWDASRALKVSNRIVDALEEEISKDEKKDPSRYLDEEDPDRPMETIEIDGYRYIGVLDIPSLGLSLPVMEEWDYTRLRISLCRYNGSYYNNDLVIAGHNYPRFFSPLRWIEPETEIYFTNVLGVEYHYKVKEVEILDPIQVEEMVSGDWDLTLFTCTTGGQARCTVRCVRVLDEDE